VQESVAKTNRFTLSLELFSLAVFPFPFLCVPATYVHIKRVYFQLRFLHSFMIFLLRHPSFYKQRFDFISNVEDIMRYN